MIAVGSAEGPLPDGTEQRMSEFTGLVATAVANAQNRSALEASRDEFTRLAEEQAALRRVATLVARGIGPAEIFAAVAEEIRPLLGADNAGISRFEPAGTSVVLVASAGGPGAIAGRDARGAPRLGALGDGVADGRVAQAYEDR
jgi:uncharacterized protein YoaH (UPF0181 family)